jgi:hypothetical protein
MRTRFGHIAPRLLDPILSGDALGDVELIEDVRVDVERHGRGGLARISITLCGLDATLPVRRLVDTHRFQSQGSSRGSSTTKRERRQRARNGTETDRSLLAQSEGRVSRT